MGAYPNGKDLGCIWRQLDLIASFCKIVSSPSPISEMIEIEFRFDVPSFFMFYTVIRTYYLMPELLTEAPLY